MKKRNIYLSVSILFIFTFVAFLFSDNNIFPHKIHSDSDVECKACHSKIPASTKTKDNNFPDMNVCTKECHESTILNDIKLVKSAPQFKIEFNHEMHIDQDLKCSLCHKEINADKFSPGSAFPAMSVCYKCHDNKNASKSCSLCHSEKVLFPHKLHIENAGCEDCHKKIKKSTDTDNGKDIPSKKICNDCHEESVGYSGITEFPYKQIYKFNHKLHVEQDLSCKDCHEALYKKNIIRQSEIVPKMEYCFECHDNATASKHCMLCHINPTMPKDHLSGWINLHKVKANNDFSGCVACHNSKSYCLRCHKGAVKPKSHHPVFELKHNEAGKNVKNCNSCHSERQCRNCHRSRGVTTGGIISRKIHPSGWNIPGSPNFHKRKARLKLSTCTACHSKRDCRGCHNPGFIGPRKK